MNLNKEIFQVDLHELVYRVYVQDLTTQINLHEQVPGFNSDEQFHVLDQFPISLLNPDDQQLEQGLELTTLNFIRLPFFGHISQLRLKHTHTLYSVLIEYSNTTTI